MKRQTENLILMWVALLLVLPHASNFAVADEKKAEAKADPPKVAWAESLVTVKANGALMTGVVVKADSKTALILTTFPHSLQDGDSSPNGRDVMVSIKSRDGKFHEIQGKVNSSFNTCQNGNEAVWHTVFVEVKHNGLDFAAVPIAERVPGKDASLTVVGRHSPDSKPSASLQNAKLVSEVDPANSHDLLGQLSGTNLLPESLLTVHDENGSLAGIGSLPSLGGQGGFGGGSGFFSVPDPFNNSSPEIERQPTFTSVVDRAERLRQMGVPMSDAAIELQKQRRRINTDAFGRPIQGNNLQITWSDDHKELHGFSNAHGEWTKLSIKEQDVIIPIVGKNVGAVSLDGKIAAYSPETGQWDVMTLRPGSQMPPSLSTDIVTVRDGKDYYTFAASSGIWTSPTNPDYQKHSVTLQASNSAGFEKLQEAMGLVNNRAVVKSRGEGMMTISGIRHHVVAAERMVREIENESSTKNSAASLSVPVISSVGSTGLNGSLPDMRASSPGPGVGGPGVGGPGPGMAGRTVGRLESQSLDLAKQLRGQTAPSADKQAQLKELVTKSLDERLRQQRTAAKRLREKLESVEKALQSREANRERIIERRVEELLDPNVDWATLQPGSSPARLSGRLATGTAIGLPGPVHVPLGSDARFPAVASVQPAAATDGNSALSLFESLKKARSIAVDVHGPGIPEMESQLAYWQQPIDEIRKRYGKDLSAKTREESIQATKDNLNQRKKEFNDAFGVWQATWREYETQREAKRLDVEEAKTRSDATKEKLHRIQGLVKHGSGSLPELKEIETQLKLQTIELRRATNAIESIDQIRKDHPELDPNSFDTSELLDEEQTSASLNARVDPEVVLVKFGASYCSPCQKMAPALQRMEKDKYPVRNVDITLQTDIARDHKIVRIPTMILLVDGEEAQRFVGVITEEELRKAMNDAARKQDLQRKPDARLSPSGKGV